MQDNESSILIHQGFLYRLSEHRKLWNLRGIGIFMCDDEEITVQIVKQEEIATFHINDVIDIYLYTNEEFKVCINLHIDDKVITLAATNFSSEVDTMLALITSILFSRIDAQVLQRILVFSLLSMDTCGGVFQVVERNLPRFRFADIYSRIQMIVSLVDVIRQMSNDLNSAEDFTYVSHAVLLSFKLLAQLSVVALCQPGLNQIAQIQFLETPQIRHTPAIILDIGRALAGIDQDKNLHLNVNLLVGNVFGRIVAYCKAKSLFSALKQHATEHVSLCAGEFEIVQFIRRSTNYDVASLPIVEDIRRSFLASFWLQENIWQVYDDALHETNLASVRSVIKNATLSIIQRKGSFGSPESGTIYCEARPSQGVPADENADFALKFLLLPQPAETVEVLYAGQRLREQLVQIQDNVINYTYRMSGTTATDSLIYQLALLACEYVDELDICVLVVDDVPAPAVDLLVFSQDVGALPGIVTCHSVKIAFCAVAGRVTLGIASYRVSRLDLERAGKIQPKGPNAPNEAEMASPNYSFKLDAISAIQESSESFGHIQNVDELKIRLNRQTRGSNFRSFSAAESAPPNSAKRCLQPHQIAFSQIGDDAHDGPLELSVRQLLERALHSQFAEIQARGQLQRVCNCLNSSVSKLGLPESWFQVAADRVVISAGGRTVSIVCDYHQPQNMVLLRSSKLLAMLFRVADKYERQVVLYKYHDKKFQLEEHAVFINFVAVHNGKVKLLKGLENYV